MSVTNSPNALTTEKILSICGFVIKYSLEDPYDLAMNLHIAREYSISFLSLAEFFTNHLKTLGNVPPAGDTEQ